MPRKQSASSSTPASTPKRRRKKARVSALGLAASELQGGASPSELTKLEDRLRADGGCVLGKYRDPFGGKWLLLAALPIHRVAPTPYQRNLSDTHVRKLEEVIAKLGYYLDPIIAVPSEETTTSSSDARYWTPNGHHRLCAMRNLGAKSITALIIPDPSIAYRILALNTEKAHNLREKALEVVRMYRELATLSRDPESAYHVEFEEPALITLGLCYEQRPRLSGGAFHPVLKRSDTFLDLPIPKALTIRMGYAQKLLEIDDVLEEKVAQLKQRGLTSPYLKSFVVARVNPLRFRPKEAPDLSLDQVLARMLEASRKFRSDTINPEDLARTSGPSEENEEG
ncbi:MAG: chromosome partitioning protein ParB [Nitrospirae bacterium]|nr:MAG: chromosome partitioning protein ParB [Nitrospirota bacterium]